MANLIQLKRSSVANKIPEVANVAIGEPVVNLVDKVLYTKNTSNAIIVIGAGTTSNIAEGVNLYFTNTRTRLTVSQGSGVSYNNSTGVISANVTSVASRTGDVVLTNADISGLTTSNVIELTNLYFTETRANTAIDNRVTSNFISNLNFATTSSNLSQFSSTTSLELAGVISDETGTGSLVFSTNPTLITPILGTPQSGSLINTTDLPIDAGTTGTLPVARGGTGDGTAATARSNLSAFGSINIRALTSGSTYTPTLGMLECLVIATGGGGGGGGADGLDSTSGTGAGGGGAGGTAIRTYTAAQIGQLAAFNIGAGGSAGSTSGSSGTAGGATTFTPTGGGTALSAAGGALGSGGGQPSIGNQAQGGSGGVPTGGIINIEGGDGGSGAGHPVAEMGIGGSGGASYWGGGGRNGAIQFTSAVGGQAGTAFGSGGGGSASVDTTLGIQGGAGKAGVIFVLEFKP